MELATVGVAVTLTASRRHLPRSRASCSARSRHTPLRAREPKPYCVAGDHPPNVPSAAEAAMAKCGRSATCAQRRLSARDGRRADAPGDRAAAREARHDSRMSRSPSTARRASSRCRPIAACSTRLRNEARPHRHEERLRRWRMRLVHGDHRRQAGQFVPGARAEADGAGITTIEGLQPASDRLHPLQENFMRYGAAQCGFCTPGIIVAAKALLDENPTPTTTRSASPSPEISAAAPATPRSSKRSGRRPRGEAAARLPRRDRFDRAPALERYRSAPHGDRRDEASSALDLLGKVTGAAHYVGDIALPGMLYGNIKRSERGARTHPLDRLLTGPWPCPA